MRPIRLEVSGFTTFREPVEVDFDGADLFALVGPTGSGKSSLIDAMCFALYGAVPRLDLRTVAPVISEGRQEARVRLDFAIGETRYTAVRVVRRQGADRATTKEARLERGEDVLAGDADGVTKAVGDLLGLGFEEFTKCVVLPQGEFARFMHDKPAARQDLLVKLLDLDVYERMAQSANARAAAADAQLALQRERLEKDLSFATEEALAGVRTRLVALEALRARIDADEPKLEELREIARAASDEAAAAERAVALLDTIEVPPDVAALATAATEAAAARAVADEAVEGATAAVKGAQGTLEALPARAPLEAALDAHAQRTAIDAERATATERLAILDDEAARAEEAVKAATEAADVAAHALEAARVRFGAQDLARALVAGEPCPVCGRHVHELPEPAEAPDLDAAQAAVDRTAKARKAADRAAAKILQDRAGLVARAETLAEQTRALDAKIATHPDPEAARALLAEMDAADAALKQARAAEDKARARAAAARTVAEAADERLRAARRGLDTARDRVADLTPPPLGHEDLGADWRAFAEWAAEEVGKRRALAEQARQRGDAARAQGLELVETQKRACIDAGLTGATAPRDDCLTAIERAKTQAETIENALETAETLRNEIAQLEERATVARALGNHLKANAFERWVLRQALTVLVDGATQLLLQLSNGQYSLSLDKSFNFAVIDHRNADARRSARTLSGGETFLASLALALAMSDRIAQLSANTAIRLESIFLDEGFGTLDPETLETVATAIETLSSNRIVGIVTHVRDLAERVPVRYEVRKGPTTSTVERVLA